MRHYETIIFDLGGVLIDWNPDYVFDQIFDKQEDKRWFFDNVCTHDWNMQQDAGRPLKEATEEKVNEWPQFESQIRAFYGRWVEMLGGSIDATVDILKTLREKEDVQLLALTNWSHETFPIALERFDFLHWFEGIVVSGEEKTVKPLREIYEIVINRYSVDRARALFIDDNTDNVAGAKEVGLDAVHFESPQRLLTDLQRSGLLM